MVPKGTPARQSWYVTRSHAMNQVCEALQRDGEPRVVALVGNSGSGKSTAASELVRGAAVREMFSDGIVWLTVHARAKDQLPSLMQQLATMVHEGILRSTGPAPPDSEDCSTYVKERISGGHGRRGLRCLIVADNVWEAEVIAKLMETGMWVLVTTRREDLVEDTGGEAIRIDTLSEEEAESVLRGASELPVGVRLPEAAGELIELCGRVAMDIAFVGRWGTVRKRQDSSAWSDAAAAIRTELKEFQIGTEFDHSEQARAKRRMAVLRAGFEYLGTEDARVQRLYLSLAVMPDGHAFGVGDAAVLLYDGCCSVEDGLAVEGVVDTLERWSILRAEGGRYRMHDAHSSFARESLADRGDILRPSVRRWVEHMSSLDTLKKIDLATLTWLWRTVEFIGGEEYRAHRPYEAVLTKIDTADTVFWRECLEAVAWFREERKDWEGAYLLWQKLLDVEQKTLGVDHPFVLGTFRKLVYCAQRLGLTTIKWREMEINTLDAALSSQGDCLGDHNNDPDYLFALGTGLLNSNRQRSSEEAEPLFRRSLALYKEKLGPDDAKVANVIHALHRCERRKEVTERAMSPIARTMDILAAIFRSGDDGRVYDDT